MGHQNSVMLLRCVLIVPFEAEVTDTVQRTTEENVNI